MLKLLFLILAIPVSGIVTNQRSGKGIEGVVVSDGYHCTLTDASGHYALDADTLARTISITVPAAYEIPLGKDGSPAFFKYIGEEDLSFALRPRKRLADRFTLVAVSDAHVRDSMNVVRFRTESVPDIQRTLSRHKKYSPVIGITLGDQLWDVMERDYVIKQGFTSFKLCRKTVPFFYVIGNHDHNNKGGKSEYAVTEHFVRNFGPLDYSFDIGRAHFVVMDDIQYTGTQRDGIKISYTTGLNDAQMEWLREDLSYVKDKKDKVIVFCVHSPLFGRFSYKPEVKALLEEFAEAHVLSGHEHNINNVWHDDGKIWEHDIQALCGSWWFSNLSPSGCPLGYDVFSFDGPAMVEFYNKATTEERDFQMRVYSGNDSYNAETPFTGLTGEPKRTNTYGWPEELKGCFVVRIWDGTRDWDVKFVQNGIERPMKQTQVKFFDAASAAFMVDVFGAPFGGSRVYKSMVDTFWTIEAPSGDPASEKDWEIVATCRMPSGKTVTYRSRILMRDYRGFATGTHYVR
ncbi:MAG: calcineurin-like phosphoesterase C-terminal domain-containing protein [Bacteroidales bacterium]|nr:calcineurin-like phosphoesterase C-terminal domain-containing protein [Bacteroidales bacterium]